MGVGRYGIRRMPLFDAQEIFELGQIVAAHRIFLSSRAGHAGHFFCFRNPEYSIQRKEGCKTDENGQSEPEMLVQDILPEKSLLLHEIPARQAHP